MSRANSIQERLEKMVPALQEYKKTNIFSSIEVRSIVKQRMNYEYMVSRSKNPLLSDHLRYIQFEMNLDLLRRTRKRRLLLHFKPTSKNDFAIITHIHKLFKRTLSRFPNEINLWFQYIDWCTAIGSHRQLGSLYPLAISKHPLVPAFWLKAALYEYNFLGNIDAARVYFQRGLRLNPTSETLYQEFFRMELQYIGRTVKRKAALGFIPTVDQMSYYKETISKNEEPRDFDLANLVPLDTQSKKMFTGVLPCFIFREVLKVDSFKDDVDYLLSYLSIIPEWKTGEESISHKEFSKDGVVETKTEKIQVNEECLVAAGVNANAIFDIILEFLKKTFPTSEKIYSAYARAGLLLYNPSIPQLPALSSDDDDDNVITTRSSKKKKQEASVVSKVLPNSTYIHTLFTNLSHNDAVAIARFEQSLIAVPTPKMWASFAYFIKERISNYSKLSFDPKTTPEVVRSSALISSQYEIALFTLMNRALEKGFCTAELFSIWLELALQFGSELRVVSAEDIYVNEEATADIMESEIGDIRSYPVKLNDQFVTSIDSIISSLVETNVLFYKPKNSNPEFSQQQARLWHNVLDIFINKYVMSLLEDEDSIANAWNNVDALFRKYIYSVSLEHAAFAWKKYIQAAIEKTLVSIDQPTYSSFLELPQKLYQESIKYFVAARPHFMNLTKDQMELGSDMSLGTSIHLANTQQKAVDNIISKSITLLKTEYLTWVMNAVAVPAVDENSNASRITFFSNAIDFLNKITDSSAIHHTNEMYNLLLDAEITLFSIVASTKDSAQIKNSYVRIKKSFEHAVTNIGSINVDIWITYLKFLLPSPVSVTNGSTLSYANSVLSTAEQLEETSNLHWRAVRTLGITLKGAFISVYDKLTQRQS